MINYITSSLEKIGKYGETANKIKDYSSQAEIFSAFGKDIGEKYIGEIAQGLEGLNVDDAVKQLSKLKINPELTTEIVRAANDMDLLKAALQEQGYELNPETRRWHKYCCKTKYPTISELEAILVEFKKTIEAIKKHVNSLGN